MPRTFRRNAKQRQRWFVTTRSRLYLGAWILAGLGAGAVFGWAATVLMLIPACVAVIFWIEQTLDPKPRPLHSDDSGGWGDGGDAHSSSIDFGHDGDAGCDGGGGAGE
jgi:hypothetical protein